MGGVDWVFTSAGESGIVPTFCTLLPAMRKNRMKKRRRGEKADGYWDAAPERIAGGGSLGGRDVWAGAEEENRFSKRKTAA